MKAMIAAAILSLACQAGASSFTNFGQTNPGAEEVQDIIIKFKGNADAQSIGISRSMMVQSPIIEDMNIHKLQPCHSLQEDTYSRRKLKIGGFPASGRRLLIGW